MAEYLFGQVALDEPKVAWDGSCGNLATAAGLFALEQKLFHAGELRQSDFSPSHRIVPVWQANSKYRMHIHIPVDSNTEEVCTDGVPGTAPPILVEVIDPCGDSLFPSGNVSDTLLLTDGRRIRATMLFAANPVVFVKATDLGLNGTELPCTELFKVLGPELEILKTQTAKKMNMDPNNAALRVCWVASPTDYVSTTGLLVPASSVDIMSRITTEGRIHHAHTATGAMNLAVACCIPGTVPHAMLESLNKSNKVRIGHPAGVLTAFASTTEYKVKSAGLVRTARTILEGTAFI